MSKTQEAKEHPEEQLWRELKHVRAGMLGVEGSTDHLQPMTHFIDQENARLWFFVSRSADIVKETGTGAHAHFCMISKGQDYHACIMGNLSENTDRAKIDEYWNDVVAAWYNGKDDPEVTLLRFDLVDAAIWASTRNPIKFAWEVQQAKDSAKEPDVGTRTKVEFS